MPVRSSPYANSCSACGPKPAASSTAGWLRCRANPHRSTGARSARSASAPARARSPDSSWSSATPGRWPRCSPSTRRWRASSAGTSHAFDALGGVARNLVYDNLRSAVLDRRGAAIQFHPRLLELAGHYHFAPRPCTPGRPQEKSQASYYAPSCTCDTSFGCCRRSRNRFPGWATGSGPVGGSKSIVPLSSARTARSTPSCA